MSVLLNMSTWVLQVPEHQEVFFAFCSIIGLFAWNVNQCWLFDWTDKWIDELMRADQSVVRLPVLRWHNTELITMWSQYKQTTAGTCFSSKVQRVGKWDLFIYYGSVHNDILTSALTLASSPANVSRSDSDLRMVMGFPRRLTGFAPLYNAARRQIREIFTSTAWQYQWRHQLSSG